MCRIDGIVTQLAEATRARNQLESVIYQLTNELLAVRGQIDTHASETVALSKEVKSRLTKFELDGKMAVSSICVLFNVI